MKKVILSTLGLLAFYANSQNVVFNDPALKQKIVAHDQAIVGGVSGPNISLIDTDLNGEISITEAQAYTGRLYLNQNGSNFYTDLTGVEEFINITELYCENNQMTTLDVSANTALTGLHCENNQISTLNLANNTALEVLNFRYNSISTINLNSNTALTSITCTNNTLTGLNLSNQANLEFLNCSDNSISTITLGSPNSLEELVFSNNDVTTLNLTNYVNLFTVAGPNNNITSIDLSACINLETINLTNNDLTNLTLPSSTSLETLFASQNQLTSIDMAAIPNVFSVALADNLLTEIDFSTNSNLYEVYLNDNSIDSLDFTFATLYLSDVVVNNNELTFLDISNNYNTNISTFNTTGNSNLTCIEVDDVAYSTTNWTDIDAQTSFSLDCPTLVSSIMVEGENAVTEITIDGGTLLMEATVLPANATDNTYTWSVTNGTGAGTIDVNGLLTATNNGTVTVKATANDGSGISGTTIITISNQSMASIENNIKNTDLTIYPNPTNGELNISLSQGIVLIKIYNIAGQKVFETNQTNFNISQLESGIYPIKILTNTTILTEQIIIK